MKDRLISYLYSKKAVPLGKLEKLVEGELYETCFMEC
jgi:hypothetical protein